MAIDRDGDGPPLRRDEPRRDESRRDEGNDLRATPFTEEVFGEDRERNGRGRSLSLVVGVVLGLAVVGGVGWYAFREQGLPTLPTGEIQTVKADPAPYKVKPDNPGGMQVENQDKLVYDRVAKGSAPNRVETLLPPPEVPKAPPVKKPDPAATPAETKPVAVAPAVAKPAEPKLTETKPAELKPAETKALEPKSPESKPPEAKPPEVKQAAMPPAEAPKPETKSEPSTPVPAPAAPKAAPPPTRPATDPLAAAVAAATGTAPKPAPAPAESKSEPAPAAPSAPAAPPAAAAAPAPAPAGSYQVQLASVPSEEAAQSEWKRMTRRSPELAAMTPIVTKADLGEKGIFYRLRAGPLGDKAAAEALCGTLAAEKIGCIVVKP